MYLLSNSKNFTPGVKFWSSNLTGNIKIFQKVEFTRITRIKTFLEGVIFWGYKFGGGGGNFSAYENVSICNGYRVSDIFRIGDKIL